MRLQKHRNITILPFDQDNATVFIDLWTENE